MVNVTVNASLDIGLAFVRVTSIITVSHSVFVNTQPYPLHSNGIRSGVYISVFSNEASFHFKNCSFKNNSAVSMKASDTSVVKRGGGMLITLEGEALFNSITLRSCYFANNTAEGGAGLFVHFTEKAYHNTINVISSHFYYNELKNKRAVPIGADYNAGGGTLLLFDGKSTRNDINFNNCKFAHNGAGWGGGFSVVSIATPAASDKHRREDNHVRIYNCFFNQNMAEMGSALYMYCRSSSIHVKDCFVQPIIAYSNFSNNRPQSGTKQSYSSAVNIDSFPTQLGHSNFVNNNGSALLVQDSVVSVMEEAKIRFVGNAAQYGGAVHLISSWLNIQKQTELHFVKNNAVFAGGAIFSNQEKEIYIPYTHTCFIQYGNKDQPPSNWETTFIFTENYAQNSNNSIVATSILPCVWHLTSHSTLEEDIKATFCKWKHWSFTGNCTSEVTTLAKHFSNNTYTLSMIPGRLLSFDSFKLKVFDDLGHDVTDNTIFILSVTSTTCKVVVQVINKGLIAFGQGNDSHIQALIQAGDNRNATAELNIVLQDCPPGFEYDNSTKGCTCRQNLYSILHCIPEKNAVLFIGYCMSYEEKIIYGRCPFTLGLQQLRGPFLSLPEQKEELQDQFCGKLSRKGRLCGECVDTYSINVYSDSFECHNCSSSAINWITFLAVDSIPPLVFFIVVITLHISLTSGPANGFIFCSQLLTVSREITILESSWKQTNISNSYLMTDLLIDPYSIWNLDFCHLFRSITHEKFMCLGPHLKVMHILALRYLSALYPLCFLVIAYILIELHARNCRILVWLWKPLCFLCVRFRQSWRAKTSVVDAFAAFILLSYVKMVRLSLSLTSYTVIYDMNSTVVMRVVNNDPTVQFLSVEHVPFAVIGTFFLGTFGLVPPLLLTFYQFRFVQKCLNCCKLNRHGLRIFMDAFQGCYKDGKDGGPDRRFFAGLYFLFRLMVFVTLNLSTDSTTLFCILQSLYIFFSLVTGILQPYKKMFYTCVDIFFFSLLAVIAGLHSYGFNQAQTHLHFPYASFYSAYVLAFVPLIYMMCYMLTYFWKRICYPHCCRVMLIHCRQIMQRITSKHFNFYVSSSIVDDMQEEEDTNPSHPQMVVNDLPDRLLNPGGYPRACSFGSNTQRSTRMTMLSSSSNYGSLKRT